MEGWQAKPDGVVPSKPHRPNQSLLTGWLPKLRVPALVCIPMRETTPALCATPPREGNIFTYSTVINATPSVT
ncbi:hypothetical protein GCM10011450_19330 [Advenella faeciporci]|uniref:Uncharacterized protein n=1 Tax=Advenella faeciporci TaxID=797535 RepID=A0A918N0C1_9BURK|nr:hypothetical protein GCM10011450_19330 [Advenella faeciporci]